MKSCITEAIRRRDLLIWYFVQFNMPLNPKKIEGPNIILEILGTEYNTHVQTKCIPERRIVKFDELNNKIGAVRYCSVHEN